MTREQGLRDFPKWSQHFEWKYVADHYAPCRILDYGCGQGHSDIYLAMNGFIVDGYDNDPEKIDTAQYILEHQPVEVQGRARFFLDVIPQEVYNLIWFSHVLEHIEIADWNVTFNRLFSSIGNTRTPPMLVSVPLSHAYEHYQHVNHWDTADDLRLDLSLATGLTWKAWEDQENHIIKAVTFENGTSDHGI